MPFPSYADAGYLGLPPLAAIGLLLIPSAIQTLAGRIRTVIDGMMIAGAVFLCSWVVVLDEVYAAGDDGLFTTTISLAYPLGDVVLISIAMYVLLRGRERRDQIIPDLDDRARAQRVRGGGQRASPTSGRRLIPARGA